MMYSTVTSRKWTTTQRGSPTSAAPPRGPSRHLSHGFSFDRSHVSSCEDGMTPCQWRDEHPSCRGIWWREWKATLWVLSEMRRSKSRTCKPCLPHELRKQPKRRCVTECGTPGRCYPDQVWHMLRKRRVAFRVFSASCLHDRFRAVKQSLRAVQWSSWWRKSIRYGHASRWCQRCP